MNDPLEKLEAELSRMKPRRAPGEMLARIEADLATRGSRSWADRCLIGAMSAGAMAACVIVAILFGQSPGATQTTPTIAVTANVPHVGSELQAFALSTETEFWK